jgi:hypothetical protein
MITIENRVGHLMEGRFSGQLTTEQLKVFSSELSHLIVRAGSRLVFVVDWRSCDLWDADIETKLIGQARSDNFAIERSAFLYDEATPVGAQVQKLISMGRNPNRRGFARLAELFDWVGQTLGAEEMERARDFFRETSADG